MTSFKFWVILIAIGICLQSKVLNSQNVTSCNPTDFNALKSFFDSTNYNFTTNSSSSSNCCIWEGITCDASSGRVVKLELEGKKINGNLTESLGDLDELRSLNLSGNNFLGVIPAKMFRFSKLEVLDLSRTGLSGELPARFDLPFLQSLNLSENKITGRIPSDLCSNLTRIRVMDLGVNLLTGEIPSSIGNCTSLEDLCFGSNELQGGVPDALFRLRNLTRLSLQDNSLTGKLGEGIGNLSKLVFLDISMNIFSGSVPDVFHGFQKLQYFLAGTNEFSGLIPSSLSSSPSIDSLNLNKNFFEGRIRINCSAMSSLVTLDLGSNAFNGSIPDELPSCSKLKIVNLSKNKFHSEIPESYKNFQSLSYLSLSNSSVQNISSAFRILSQCKNLTTLVLTLNFAGQESELPSDPSLQFEKLKALVMANCGLKGTIPSWLRNSTQLQLLDLSWNKLGKHIPDWFGDFKLLFYLDLSNNTFSGEIPKSLTGLESLINRDISLEEPSPDFPFLLKRENARGLPYKKVLSFPPTLELGFNFLSGPIWPQFGNLKKLHLLDLRRNNLSGPIPSELSGMTSLETLDLSQNNLSGTIPSSLVNLSFLSRFNVSYNHLSGKIPTGGQFPTFANSSFVGNIDLCGDSATPCKKQDPVASPQAKSKRKKIDIIGIAIGIGIGTILLVALISTIILRNHRRGEVNNEDELNAHDIGLEQFVSRLVLFQNNDSNKDKELSIDELLKSTNNFDQANIIGCGGFGLVYKATLPDGRKVAIKRLSGDCGQMEREFQAEVEALSRAQHPNLVLLQGFCIYKNDRLLIYSFMENGSLDYWLHEKLDGVSTLDWDTRLRIAQGAARGLAYLHQSCDPHILHRDIKSSNILLDKNFEAHLADFGLARLILSPYDTHITTDLVGTLGYIPPEYGQASIATYKGDIYSFGVVLLELLTGKRPMDMCKPKGSRDIISWVIQMTKEKRETEVFDPFICDKGHCKEILQVLHLTCLCLSENPRLRPSTHELVSCLDQVGIARV